MGPAAKTSFDIADWFMERGRGENAYLPPRMLQCLLFLSQGHFAAAYEGRKLMPSVFVVDHAGPMDPNIYRAYEHGRPEITNTGLDQETLVFLDAIWRKYAGSDTDVLNQIIAELGAEEAAMCDADGAEIDIDVMRRMFAKPEPKQAGTPQSAHTQEGRPVNVQKWIPGQKPAV